MSRTTKIAIGLSVASGALLAAWLLTGDRKQKTKKFIAKRVGSIQDVPTTAVKNPFDDVEACYI
jgi:hypothetical protein